MQERDLRLVTADFDIELLVVRARIAPGGRRAEGDVGAHRHGRRRDERVAWVRELSRILDGHAGDAGTKTRVEAFLHCVREDLRSGASGAAGSAACADCSRPR